MQKGRSLSEVGAAAAAALVAGVLIFTLPLLLFGGTGLAQTAQEEQLVLPAVPSPVAAQPEPSTPQPSTPQRAEGTEGTGEMDQARRVRVKCSDGSVVETDMANYLWGVVAAEMPASFETEALMAQAVAARTYTVWKSLHPSVHADADVCTDYNCCQAWLSREDAAALWGEEAVNYTERIQRAVTATDGLILCHEGEVIQAVFHASSAGRTEDAAAVWGAEVPYLVGVDTPEGAEVPNYQTTVVLTTEEVRTALEALGCVLGEDPALWFEETAYTENGRIDHVQTGGMTLSGATLRAAFGLRSPAFTVEYGEGGFTFTVTGNGHGVGMSQYGANALAKEGKSWEEIVGWYYTGVTVEDYRSL